VAVVKQLTVYDRIRTSARDVVRWQVRRALEDQQTDARARARERRAERVRRSAELALLKQNVRKAVLELRGQRLRVVKGGKR